MVAKSQEEKQKKMIFFFKGREERLLEKNTIWKPKMESRPHKLARANL